MLLYFSMRDYDGGGWGFGQSLPCVAGGEASAPSR